MAKTPVSTIAQYAPCTIFVRGQVTYSRIASKVEGDELAKQNQMAASKGRMPHAKPYTSISIKNPVILDNGKLPPQVKSVIQERFYTKQDGTTAFTQESKSPFLPMVLYSNDVVDCAGQTIANNDIPLQGELAVGLDVTIGVSLFSKNGFAGLGIKYVLINEPIRYYTNAELESDLASLGIMSTAAPAAQSQAAPVAPTPQTYAQPAYTAPAAPAYTAPAPQATAYNQQPFTPPAQPTAPAFNSVPWEEDAPVAPAVQKPVRYY